VTKSATKTTVRAPLLGVRTIRWRFGFGRGDQGRVQRGQLADLGVEGIPKDGRSGAARVRK